MKTVSALRSFALLLFIYLLLVSTAYSEKNISVKTYSPVDIYSSLLNVVNEKYKQCILNLEFRNNDEKGRWIILFSPADTMTKKDVIFRSNGSVKFSFNSRKVNDNGSDKSRVYSSVTLENMDGTGLMAFFLEAGVKVRIKELQLRLLRYPAYIFICTANELKINGNVSLIKWISGLNRGEKAAVESLILTSEDLKTVEAFELKNWVYLLKDQIPN